MADPNIPRAPTNAEIRSVTERRDQTHTVFHDQNAPTSTLPFPRQLWLPGNARYRRVTRFLTQVGLTTQLELILTVQIDAGGKGILDYLGADTSNFGIMGDDEDIEWRLLQDGVMVPTFPRWTGMTQPLREPIRQETPTVFPSGSLVQVFARLIPVVEGGVGDGLNSFDVRTTLNFWFIPN